MIAMSRPFNLYEDPLLDTEVWDVPARMTEEDFFVQAGSARRRGGPALFDPEDER